MKEFYLRKNLKEIVAAILPCTWSYNYIGKYVLETYGEKLENNFYKEWVNTYSSQEFTDFSDEWIEYTDGLCENLSENEKEKLTVQVQQLKEYYVLFF